MGVRKIIRWASHGGGSQSGFRLRESSQSMAISEKLFTLPNDEWLNENTGAEPSLLMETQVSSKALARSVSLNGSRSLLARRGIDRGKQDLLTIQPNKISRARPLLDLDFFDEIPAISVAQLENLTSIAAGSPCNEVSLAQVEGLLDTLDRNRDGARGTPVYESTPKARKNSKSREASSDRIEDRKRQNLMKPKIEIHGGTELSRIELFDDETGSHVMKLENLSKVSHGNTSPIMRLNASMVHIDNVFENSASSVESTDSQRASIVSTSSTGPSESASIHYSPCPQPDKAEFHDAQNGEMENEDYFLHLAQEDLRVKGRSSRPLHRRKAATKPCAAPPPAPEIVTAQARIHAFKPSGFYEQFLRDLRSLRGDGNVPTNESEKMWQASKRITKAGEMTSVQAYLADLIFVQSYKREMKARCELGVWWEGWLILRNLERQ